MPDLIPGIERERREQRNRLFGFALNKQRPESFLQLEDFGRVFFRIYA